MSENAGTFVGGLGPENLTAEGIWSQWLQGSSLSNSRKEIHGPQR